MTVEPIRLDEFVAQADDTPRWRVKGLWPARGRILLAAQYKAGKTTLMGNLIRSLVDDELFLDRFTCTPAKRIVLIDDELDPLTLRRWLSEQGIIHQSHIEVITLRGRVREFDIMTPEGRAPWVEMVKGADIVILDCLRPVLDALGLSEAVGAGKFVLAFDALLREAQVSEAAVVHHMGHDAQSSRGDSRLRDWPDVEWRLTRAGTEPDAPRYFTAYGRDVDQPKQRLYFDEANRHLTLRKPGPPEEDRKPVTLADVEAKLGTLPRLIQPEPEPPPEPEHPTVWHKLWYRYGPYRRPE